MPVLAYKPPADAPARAPAVRSVCRRGARTQWAAAAAGQQIGSGLLNVQARDSVVIQDKVHVARPAQIVAGVDLVIVIAPAFIYPGINVGKRYRARVPLVNLEFSVAEYPGRWQTLRALTSALRL